MQRDRDVVSQVGAASARLSAIPISEGFNLGFSRCKPGRGPLMHNHDTNETFMPITGRWRCARNEDRNMSSWTSDRATSKLPSLAIISQVAKSDSALERAFRAMRMLGRSPGCASYTS
jgi:hypothetical protein